MAGFLNFIVVLCVGYAAWRLIGRYLQRLKVRNMAIARASDELKTRSDRLNSNLADLPEDVMSGLSLMYSALAGNADARDVFEAALEMESVSPSDEGEIAHLAETDRSDFIEAAALVLGIMDQQKKRRWRKFVKLLEADPALAGRAAIWGHVTKTAYAIL